TVLGRAVAGPFSREYCGGGDADDCRAVLQASLAQAVAVLTAEDGNAPSSWDVDEKAEKSQFSPVGLVEIEPMQWQNRPTFQQVMVFAGTRSVVCPLEP